MEWSFKKAITIKTYSSYHPVPVPFNLLSIPLMAICRQCQKCICRRFHVFHESTLDESGRVSYNFAMHVTCGKLIKHKTMTTTTTTTV